MIQAGSILAFLCLTGFTATVGLPVFSTIV
jgi:hypothetical protein